MKKTIICICISILIIIGLASPFLVHFNSPNVTSEITADGTLEYIIGCLSFITTGALALYAIFQTNKSNDIAKNANDMTNQLLKIEKDNYRLQIRPFILITKYDIKQYTQAEILDNDNKDKLFIEVGGWDENSHTINGIALTITNTTESFLTFKFNGIENIDSDINWRHCTTGEKNIRNTKISLMSGESKDIVLLAGTHILSTANGKSVNLNFLLKNRFTNTYKETIKMIFLYGNKIGNHMSIFLSFEDIHLYKLENKEGKDIWVKEEL